jgi:hypothetical protein
MSEHTSFSSILTSAQRAAWQIDEIIGTGQRFDFSRPFLPESLSRAQAVAGLSPREQLTLSHIRGHEYLSIFGVVEEFILPFVLDHVRPHLAVDDERTRALLQFAGEEAKHIQLFKRFHAAFTRDFGVDCDVIGPVDAIGAAVLAHDPLAVALVILQIEWMTQRHYVDSVRGDQAIDPLFASLLRHHWIEEAQHARLDALMVEALADGLDAAALDRAIEDYFAIAMMLDGGLRTQAEFNLAAFERATGRTLDDVVRAEFVAVQHQAARWTYLGSGMTHPKFRATLGRIHPAGLARVDAAAPAFC